MMPSQNIACASAAYAPTPWNSETERTNFPPVGGADDGGGIVASSSSSSSSSLSPLPLPSSSSFSDPVVVL